MHADGHVKLSENNFFKGCKASWSPFSLKIMGGAAFCQGKLHPLVGKRKNLNTKWVIYYNQVSLQQKLMKERNKHYILRGAETKFKKVEGRAWIFVGVCVGCPGVRSQLETERPDSVFWSSGIGVIQKDRGGKKSPFCALLFKCVNADDKVLPMVKTFRDASEGNTVLGIITANGEQHHIHCQVGCLSCYASSCTELSLEMDPNTTCYWKAVCGHQQQEELCSTVQLLPIAFNGPRERGDPYWSSY